MNLMKKTLSAAVIAVSVSAGAIAGEKSEQKSFTMSDAWLDGKAETVLLLNENLNNFAIDTDVHNGVVILSGEVESNIDKRLAEELIIGIDGVKKVKNKLTVANNESLGETLSKEYTDTKIAAVVKTRLLLDREVSGTKIDVSAQEGTITLKGSVKSGAQKDLAEAIAENTDDVEKVVNKLKVTG
ncbi:BON domain-containing protein [uncultured Microbulbifer sp.]|uniref:BON domain-containing protein n=1 Tax=uncultured Microbulbifer sp. TaxID=348147 RepID=UPI00260CC0E9|nr:BON domain-containing protein [uncultured Microbulbifer sp.]